MDVLYGLTKDFVFKEAVAFLKGKRTLTSEEYKMLSDESRAKAFTVSGYTSLEVLQEFLDCLTKAAEEGTTKEQFLEDMNRFLEEHGYEGINPWKCDNIFRTNMQTALNAAKTILEIPDSRRRTCERVTCSHGRKSVPGR